MRFTNASSILYVLLIRFIHLSFLYYTGITEQAFGEGVILSFNPFVFSLSHNYVQTFRLLLFEYGDELSPI